MLTNKVRGLPDHWVQVKGKETLWKVDNLLQQQNIQCICGNRKVVTSKWYTGAKLGSRKVGAGSDRRVESRKVGAGSDRHVGSRKVGPGSDRRVAVCFRVPVFADRKHARQ